MRRIHLVWGGAAVGVFTLAMYLTVTEPALAGHPHPNPRSSDVDLASTVWNPDRGTHIPRVAQAYRIAETIPFVLDGIHCHCECRENFGHHSLFTCFQTGHGARCDICLTQAEMADRMTQRGDDLTAIRSATDEMFRYRYQ